MVFPQTEHQESVQNNGLWVEKEYNMTILIEIVRHRRSTILILQVKKTLGRLLSPP